MTINLENFVPDLEAGFCRRLIGHQVADGCRRISFGCGTTNCPDDQGEQNREQETKEWAGKCDDDFVQRLNSRKILPRVACLPFDSLHRRHLREQNEPAGWDRAKAKLDALDCLFP